MKGFLKYLKIGIILAGISFLTALVPFSPLRTLASGTSFSGGNILEGRNVTTGESDFHDPVNASADQHVKMLVRVVNQGSEDAQNTKVKFDLSNGIAPSVQISADNAGTQSDGLTLSPGGASLELVSGSGKKFGPGCDSGCAVGDEIASGGVSLGTVAPSETSSFQVGIEFVVKGTPSGGGSVTFRGGEFFDGGNRTQRLVDWQDPIPANPGDVIEFRVKVVNDGTARAENTSVRVEFPTVDSTTLTPRAFISGSGASEVSDAATVNVTGSVPQGFSYIGGHARMFGPGCNGADGCPLPDGIAVHGVTIGAVDPGETNSFQVAFKVNVTNQQPQTHKACVNSACAVVSGSGDNSCSSNSDCTVQTHYECRSNACVVVSGGGNSTCSSDSQCQSVSQRAICDSLSVSKNSGTAPLYVNSTLSGHTENGGSIVSYRFNFGDGTGDFSQSGNSLGHTFNNVGTYVISGVVTDNSGNQAGGSACQKVITVGQVLGTSTPPRAIPKTGPETAALFGLFGSGTIGWILRKFRVKV